MKLVFSSLLALSVIGFMVLTSTSPTIEASSASCGPAVHLPPGSKAVRAGGALMVTYPDGSLQAFDCSCSGSGACSELGTKDGVVCTTSNCSNCVMNVTLVKGGLRPKKM